LAEYRNPQTEPGSEKRLLLIFLISFVFMLLAQPLLKKYFPTPPPPQKIAQTEETPPAPPASKVDSHTAATPSAPAVTKQAAGETETVIESDLYRVTFTNRGGTGQILDSQEIRQRCRNREARLGQSQCRRAVWISALAVDL